MAIGDRIQFYRKSSGLTQSRLAELIGVSPQAISKWETGTGFPDISLLVPLAIALRITTDELLEHGGGLNLSIVKAEWNSMAAAYELFNNAPDSYSYTIEWPCVQSLLPALRGKAILEKTLSPLIQRSVSFVWMVTWSSRTPHSVGSNSSTNAGCFFSVQAN